MHPLIKLESRWRNFLLSTMPLACSVMFYGLGREWFFKKIAKEKFDKVIINATPANIFGLRFRNSLGNAAGFDKNAKLLDYNFRLGAGFAIVGTVLDKPFRGRLVKNFPFSYNAWIPLPKSHASINSLGLPNDGIDKVLERIKRFKDKNNADDFPIGLSLAEHPADCYEKKMAGVLQCIDKAFRIVDFYEINVSCPNVEHHRDQKYFEKKIKYFSQEIDNKKPLFLKVSALDDIEGTLELFEKYNITALTISNTLTNYDFLAQKLHEDDRKLFYAYTKKHKGGVSGKLIENHVFKKIEQLCHIIDREKMNLKIIHCGGIFDALALEKAKKYTVLQQWYTGLLENILQKSSQDVYGKIFKNE